MVQSISRHAQLTAVMTMPVQKQPRVCPRWSEEEEKIMRERYRLDGPNVLAERFKRSVGSIRTKASSMELRLRGQHRPAVRTAEANAPAVTQVQQPTSVVATPVLNARASAKTKKDAQPSAIAKMLEQMRQLLPTHPRRLAYALAARNGTGIDAYNAWKNWKPQPQIA